MRNEKKNRFFVNSGLFSTSFLSSRVYSKTAFNEVSKNQRREIWTRLVQAWEERKERFTVSTASESDTEKLLIDKVIQTLGFSSLTKMKLRTCDKTLFPDYVLFRNEADAVCSLKAEEEFKFKKALCVLEGKRFGLDLNQKEIDREDPSFPSVQLVRYLQNIDLDWGILTNGAQWQLYYRRGQYAATNYLEFDLIDMLSHPEMPREFELFSFLFSPEAFIRDSSGKCALDEIYEDSKRYAQDIGKPFFIGCKEALEVSFNAFMNRCGKRTKANAELCYDAAMILLFRIISIRYLEDRGVLPTLCGEYRDVSLDVMRISIEKSIRSAMPFSKSSTKIWQRLLCLFKDVNKGTFGVYPGHAGFETELFAMDADAFFAKNPLSDDAMSAIIDSVCRGGGKVKSGHCRRVDHLLCA